MRSTRTLSVTLPPEMLKRAQSIAKRESRTMSKLVREALRHYDRRAWWDEVNAYGRQRAEERGSPRRGCGSVNPRIPPGLKESREEVDLSG